ncbi:unnamed protein product [Cyberlindnera jadinii]|uniref:Cell wall mannoprotein PIR1-like C-terminal domain-containing protein n=2 Tax=Cyberlindnera jadinii (strain ATCC 18201 / CBS 1600 / BCRC 20928 / JCM 3617 / NBRC 0987 / NRRL Y-1542) TaxID=983966 RepID=A0A0H5C864_CYBJN|nr:unnamed protein product [Cyberlindnera jadinii]
MKSFAIALSVFALGYAATTEVESVDGTITSSVQTATTTKFYNPATDSVWSTFTPANPAPTDALVNATGITFGIAIDKVTNETVLSSLSEAEIAKTATTTSISSTSAEESSSSSSSESESATATLAVEDYFKQKSARSSTALAMTLNNTILLDSHGRVGSIVANRQFQFDGPPPQAGAIYAAGWAISTDGNLMIGDNDIFYQCLSGTFYNLYDESLGEHCQPVYLQAVEFVN